jgi:acetylornithine/N-succinyldiaminopimelate aminotransferase
MAASGKPAFRDLFEPKVPGFPKAVLNDLASVEAHIGPQTVAVMIEPVQGEAGVWCASDDFLRDLRQLTRDAGLLLIVDEVQTGMGRTGTLWAHQHAGIEPDVMTLGKMLGGGVPLSALLATETAACFQHGDQGGTLNGNPLMTAVGCAVLEGVLAPGLLDAVRERGRQLETGLRALSVRHALGDVRGRGLLWALDLDRSISGDVVERARDAGLLVNAPQPGILRFMPPLNVSAAEIGCALAILDGVLGGL